MTRLNVDVALDRGRFHLQAQMNVDVPVLGLFGASGSGKSTLLAVLCGLLTPDRGRIELDGDVLFDAAAAVNVRAHLRRVGLVFQDAQLFPHLTVKGNLQYGLRRLAKDARRFEWQTVVDLMRLGGLLAAYPRNLSGGERQRVALARALLASPRLLLLDEPLASLDVGLKQEILPFMQDVKRTLSMPMIYVSHDLGEILSLTDHIASMADGRIVEVGAVQELHEPIPGLDNVQPVVVSGHDPANGCTYARLGNHDVVLPLQPAAVVGERAFVHVSRRDIALALDAVPGISIQNQLRGRVVSVHDAAHACDVVVDLGVRVHVGVTQRARMDLNLQPGQTVVCLIKAQAFRYL